jgi:hypothetical protein
MSKLLIACPIKDSLMLPTMRAIIELDPATHVTGYERSDIVYLRTAATLDPRDAVAEQYNEARRIVLEQGYDALMTVEADMLPPPNAIRRLFSAKADIAYGLYIFRRPPWEWSAYVNVQGMGGMSYSGVPDLARRVWGEVVEVEGMGLGCTLIQRNVLERLEFRAHGGYHADGKRSHCDWYFAADAREHQFTQRCDTAVICGHIHPTDEAGTGGPTVLWPTDEAPFYRFEPFAECMERMGF